MAVTYGAVGATVGFFATPTSVAYPAGISAGNLLVLVGMPKVGATALASQPALSGWTSQGYVRHGTTASANDTGSMAVMVWTKVADGTETGSVSVAWGLTPAAGQAFMYRLANATGGWDVAVQTVARTATTTAWSVTFGANPGLTVGDHIAVANSVPTDLCTASSAGTLTATGLTTPGAASSIVPHVADGTGSDSAIWADYYIPTAGTASAAPTYASTLTGGTNLFGVSAIIRAREIVVAPTGVSAGADDSHPVNVAFTRTATQTGATSHEWKIQTGTGAGTVIGTAAALNWTPTSTGTYVLRYTATNSAGSTFDDMTLDVVTPVSLAGITDRVASMTGVVFRIRAADLALAHGASVTSWTALVGSALTGTGTYRTASTVNNRPVVQFNGASDTYTNATSHTSISNRTLGFVYASRTIAATDRELYAAGSTEVILNTDFIKVFGGTGNAISTSAVAVDTPYVTTATASTTANEVIYQNGTSVANAQAGALSATTSVRIGSSGGTTRWHDGPIAEMVIWDHELDATERADWHSYVQDAYGVTVSDYTALASGSTASGAITLGGSVTATATAPSTAGAITLGGAPTGRAAATAAGAITLGGSATPSVAASSAGTITLGGSATASQPGSTASGSVTLGGSVTAQARPTAAGTVTLGGTVTAQAPATSTTGAITLGGAPTARAAAAATGTVTLGGSGTATQPGSSASGTITLGGTVTAGVTASAAGSITLSGSPTARAAATVAGTVTLGGTSTATAASSAAGSITLTGAPTARAAATTTGVITLGGAGTVQVPGSTAAGSITLSGAPTARGAGSVTGVIVLGGTPTGRAAATTGGVIVLGGAPTVAVGASVAGAIFLSGIANGVDGAVPLPVEFDITGTASPTLGTAAAGSPTAGVSASSPSLAVWANSPTILLTL